MENVLFEMLKCAINQQDFTLEIKATKDGTQIKADGVDHISLLLIVNDVYSLIEAMGEDAEEVFSAAKSLREISVSRKEVYKNGELQDGTN